MSKLDEIRDKVGDTSNAFFKMVIRETGVVVAYVSMTIEETDEALDEFNKMNSGKFKYIQISKEDYDKQPICF